jgi:predicted RNA-binding protein with PUA-like domain
VARWLLKSEPGTYSFDDLVRDKKTVWDGVANATALIHIRAMKKGDEAVVYHTGDEKAAVGLAAVASDPYPDPAGDNPKLAVVDLKVGRRLAAPVPLSAFKADSAFAGWDLLRIGRLSVVPVPDAMWDRMLTLAAGGGDGGAVGAASNVPTSEGSKASKPKKVPARTNQKSEGSGKAKG